MRPFAPLNIFHKHRDKQDNSAESGICIEFDIKPTDIFKIDCGPQIGMPRKTMMFFISHDLLKILEIINIWRICGISEFIV